MSSSSCNEWLLNKLVNPRTGRAIKPTGKVYKDLQSECSSHPASTASSRGSLRNPSKVVPKAAKVLSPEDKAKLDAHRESVATKTPFELRLIKVFLERVHESLNYLMDPEIDPATGSKIEPLRRNILEVESNQVQEGLDDLKKATFQRYNNKTKVLAKVLTQERVCEAVVAEFKRLPQDKPVEQGYNGSIDKVPTHVIVAPVKGKASVQYSIGTLVNYLINAQVCPNYQYSYTERICEGCGPLKVPSEAKVSRCAFIFKEAYDLTLEELFSSVQPRPVELSILGQLIMAVHYLHHTLGIVHNGLLSKNIYLTRTPELKGKYMSYWVEGLGMFLIENQGYMVVLGNFENVQVIDESMMAFRKGSSNYRMHTAFAQDNQNILLAFQEGLKVSPSLDWILHHVSKPQARSGKVVGATMLLEVFKMVYMEGTFDMIKTVIFHPVK